MNVADITFIGSGTASTVTLTELFEKLLKENAVEKKLNITVVEKTPELWVGVPYGYRSSVNALTITHALDFIYPPERPLFFEWLIKRKSEWSAWYREQGGFIAARWLENNMPVIERKDWEAVYIPRFLFGWYLNDKLTALRRQAEEKHLAEITVIQAEATDINSLDGGLYEIMLELPGGNVETLTTHKLVIATGSAPVRKMYAGKDANIIYVNDIYEPSVDENTATVLKALKSVTKNERNVLVIGSNASAIELLYLLEGHAELRAVINKTVVISPGGLLPYPISTEVIADHSTPTLDKLKAEGNYNLESLMEATTEDLKLAVEKAANVAYIASIMNKTNELLEVLGEEAKKVFTGIYGMKLSQKFRRSGPEYKGGSQALIDNNEVTLLKGEYISASPSGSGVSLHYRDTDSGKEETHPLIFKVIINCSGSDNLDKSSSRLIYNMVHHLHCAVNLSGKGFEVNEKFEASPNLFIMGPLLGGNMNKLIHFWHLENAPRLMYLAPHLAGILLEN